MICHTTQSVPLALTKAELSYHCLKLEPTQHHGLHFQFQCLVYIKLLMFPHSLKLPLYKPRYFTNPRAKQHQQKWLSRTSPIAPWNSYVRHPNFSAWHLTQPATAYKLFEYFKLHYSTKLSKIWAPIFFNGSLFSKLHSVWVLCSQWVEHNTKPD